ncbi:SA1362 family protein [Staphylococcus piscifermentans]|uniref:SA1362 family protein n=1 Tax=Staphylococcus piscifermentans TaxID=70258 RepID=UPI00142DBF06|nr:SA1362 family protein [Staphylococcus piscifermentans]
MKKILFYAVLLVALIGLITNLDAILFSLARMVISLAILAGIAYLVYFFFFLTEDQRKYKKARWKYKWRNR